MKISMLFRCFAFFSLVAFVSFIYANDTDSLYAVERDGSTKISFHRTPDIIINVVVEQTRINKNYPYKHALLWGGDVQKMPSSVLSMIKVIDGGKNIFVPLSAYCDLGDVKYLSLSFVNNGFNINIHGGETASSYDVVMKFKYGYLVSRIVKLREFPDQRNEKTIYKWPSEN